MKHGVVGENTNNGGVLPISSLRRSVLFIANESSLVCRAPKVPPVPSALVGGGWLTVDTCLPAGRVDRDPSLLPDSYRDPPGGETIGFVP